MLQMAVSAATLFGLLLTLAGAAIAARAVILSEAQADEISGTYYDRNDALKRNLLSQSRRAQSGLRLIAAGTFLQALAAAVATALLGRGGI